MPTAGIVDKGTRTWECSLGLDALRDISDAWATSRTTVDETGTDLLDEAIGDAEYDLLTGSSGADLFIISLGDKVTDYQFGKPQTNKDGDVVIKDGVVTA